MTTEASWVMVRVEPSADSQRVIDGLFAAGSQGVHEDGTAIVTHFPHGTSVPAIRDAVLSRDPDARIHFSDAPAADWSEWRASVHRHELGNVTITPPWLRNSDASSIQVVIDPEMAFGTGEHATTRGVIRLMQQLPRMPEVVADLGSGSAVLAIVAAKLGARRVAAIELDADAIANAEANVLANGETATVGVIHGDAALLLPLVAPVGLILANIISSVLIELLPAIRASLQEGGNAILSGILIDERGEMLSVLASGWQVLSEDLEEGWWSVLITPRP